MQATAATSADRADGIVQQRIVQSAGEAERLLDRAALYGGTFLGVAGFLGFLFLAWFRIMHRRGANAVGSRLEADHTFRAVSHPQNVDKARRALEVVTARVTRELQRFKALRAAELRRAIASYVALQAEHSAALRDQWAELLPDLDAGAPPLPPPPAEEAVGV